MAGFSPYADVLDIEDDILINPCILLSSLYTTDLVWYLVPKGRGSLSFMVSWALLHHLKSCYMSQVGTCILQRISISMPWHREASHLLQQLASCIESNSYFHLGDRELKGFFALYHAKYILYIYIYLYVYTHTIIYMPVICEWRMADFNFFKDTDHRSRCLISTFRSCK